MALTRQLVETISEPFHRCTTRVRCRSFDDIPNLTGGIPLLLTPLRVLGEKAPEIDGEIRGALSAVDGLAISYGGRSLVQGRFDSAEMGREERMRIVRAEGRVTISYRFDDS